MHSCNSEKQQVLLPSEERKVVTDLTAAAQRRRVRSIARCPLWVCAVKRRRFPVGANPTRQPLQPEATGAANEVAEAFD